MQLLVMGIPILQKAFKLQMLDIYGWINVLILGMVPIVVNEAVKAIARSRKAK